MVVVGKIYIVWLTEVPLQERQRRPVAEVHGHCWVDLPLQLHHLPDPVPRQEGEVREALVDRPPVGVRAVGARQGRPKSRSCPNQHRGIKLISEA